MSADGLLGGGNEPSPALLKEIFKKEFDKPKVEKVTRVSGAKRKTSGLQAFQSALTLSGVKPGGKETTLGGE